MKLVLVLEQLPFFAVFLLLELIQLQKQTAVPLLAAFLLGQYFSPFFYLPAIILQKLPVGLKRVWLLPFLLQLRLHKAKVVKRHIFHQLFHFFQTIPDFLPEFFVFLGLAVPPPFCFQPFILLFLFLPFLIPESFFRLLQFLSYFQFLFLQPCGVTVSQRFSFFGEHLLFPGKILIMLLLFLSSLPVLLLSLLQPVSLFLQFFIFLHRFCKKQGFIIEQDLIVLVIYLLDLPGSPDTLF